MEGQVETSNLTPGDISNMEQKHAIYANEDDDADPIASQFAPPAPEAPGAGSGSTNPINSVLGIQDKGRGGEANWITSSSSSTTTTSSESLKRERDEEGGEGGEEGAPPLTKQRVETNLEEIDLDEEEEEEEEEVIVKKDIPLSVFGMGKSGGGPTSGGTAGFIFILHDFYLLVFQD